MTHSYQQGPFNNILKETVSRITYKTEYSQHFTGLTAPLRHIKIPSHLHRPAWERFPCPGTSRAIQPPCAETSSKGFNINVQCLQPRQTPREQTSKKQSAVYERQKSCIKSILQSSASGSRSASSCRKVTSPAVEKIRETSPILVARRLQSQLSRFPKDYRYITNQCFFYNSVEPMRKFYVVAPDWVSENNCRSLRKNNVFG